MMLGVALLLYVFLMIGLVWWLAYGPIKGVDRDQVKNLARRADESLGDLWW